ncbi:MAG: sugar ABC transporter substrate-binding protein, partial [Treponema sp.]|nr:sugar ABC transporter substrate-binding protein [Treponema sp.]
MKKSFAVAGAALAALVALTGMSCSKKDGGAANAPASSGGGKTVTIKYELWDSNQLPAYQAAADEFTRRNPNI